MKFTANYVEPYTNSITASVMFANTEENPDEPTFLSLQRPIEFEDSNYYFEINDQSYSRYGGLELVEFSRSEIVVVLEQSSVEKFDGNEDFRKIQVHFEINDAAFADILSTLRNIFEGHDIYHEK
ncbi:MAG: hypothetical protein IPN96_03660 [Anaerolineales bacterium]|uniref:Imm10 family immunity protein n=1 Tax=Candidatus Villigracilis proximus TaxID=3140683 RepID=UPI003135DE65|nr:hypothetical protein [Anaerolineales bacterium]MBK9209461.1 hypothetical protein [Anaerolineales bacterium]